MAEDEPRLASRKRAAELIGLSPSAFSQWVQKGWIPGPVARSRKWDMKAVRHEIDRLSGISKPDPGDPFDDWLRAKATSEE